LFGRGVDEGRERRARYEKTAEGDEREEMRVQIFLQPVWVLLERMSQSIGLEEATGDYLRGNRGEGVDFTTSEDAEVTERDISEDRRGFASGRKLCVVWTTRQLTRVGRQRRPVGDRCVL
jgi:hypothetical protein